MSTCACAWGRRTKGSIGCVEREAKAAKPRKTERRRRTVSMDSGSYLVYRVKEGLMVENAMAVTAQRCCT